MFNVLHSVPSVGRRLRVEFARMFGRTTKPRAGVGAARPQISDGITTRFRVLGDET